MSRSSTSRGLWVTNLVILNHSQVTRTTPERAYFHVTPTGALRYLYCGSSSLLGSLILTTKPHFGMRFPRADGGFLQKRSRLIKPTVLKNFVC
ncbi:hypothetical protein TNCV_4006271 [Trichonephila clavipes]|nr:hypothetical protein TNCV_4006271 [Trichonephila clavipes]